MAVSTRRLMVVTVMIAAVLLSATSRQACGPFQAEAIFTYSAHPDFPLDEFAAGQLGVLQPSYARSYLAVAYRYLCGTGFDKTEQQALVALWSERLELDSSGFGSPAAPPSWAEARKLVPGANAIETINVERPINPKEPYTTYLNCPEDAFVTATQTIKRLIAEHGASSPEVASWLAAQDEVFSNCGGGQTIPAQLQPGASTEARANRAYQIAAANFYSGNFDEAEKLFDSIAADRSSRWRALGPYLAARSVIRKATLNGKDGESDSALLAKAEVQLRRVLADPGRSEVHRPARGALRYVLARSKRDQVLHEIAGELMKKNSGDSLRQNLADYTWVMDRLVPDEDAEKKFDTLPAVGREDDLTDWVFVFQATDRKSFEYSFQKWSKSGSLPWLVAAISKCESTYPQTAALIEAAAKINPQSPGYLSVVFQRLRLLVDSGEGDKSRQLLESILDVKNPRIPVSTRNLLLALRAQLAGDLDEFLTYAQRVPAGLTYNEDEREVPFDPKDDPQLRSFAGGRACFDIDSATVLNSRLPLGFLKRAASSTVLSATLRKQVALASWVRAVLLDDDQTAMDLAPVVQIAVPELKNEFAGYLGERSVEARKFTAILTMLRFPGTRPIVDAGIGRTEQLSKLSNFRDNWWCPIEPADGLTKTGSSEASLPPDIIRIQSGRSPAFLTAAQRAMAENEAKKLAALGPAPNYFCAQAVKWANARPDDPRAPEALHLAVRATRYGCTDDATGRLSKQAFDTLHRKYPRSTWAQKTKYWFKG
jgi:tetratricopeptide (TPR) repeat protein